MQQTASERLVGPGPPPPTLLPSMGKQSAYDAFVQSRVGFALIITAFLSLNGSLNMLNRWVLGYKFHFPVLLTMFHLTFGFLALTPFMLSQRIRPYHKPTIQRLWRGFAAVGTFKVANVVLLNMSLVSISLSLNQIIRSGIPVVTALLGIVIEGKVPTGFELASLVTLSIGVMLSVWEGSLSGSAHGILLAIASVFAGAAMLNFSGKVLAEKVDVFRLIWYTAPISVGVLVPVFLWQEFATLRSDTAVLSPNVMLLLLAGGANAVAYNCVHYLTIKTTSAVTTPVIGMVKVVGLVVVGAVVLGERDILNLRMLTGCALALAGFCGYSWAKVDMQALQGSTSPGSLKVAPSPPKRRHTAGGDHMLVAADEHSDEEQGLLIEKTKQ